MALVATSSLDECRIYLDHAATGASAGIIALPDRAYRIASHGNMLSVACAAAGLVLCDVRSATMKCVLCPNVFAISTAFHPDGKRVYGGLATGEIIAVDVDSRAIVSHLTGGHTQSVHSIKFSPSGNAFVTSSNDATACVWSTGSGEVLMPLEGHRDGCFCALFIDESTVATASKDNSIGIWNATDGSAITFLVGHSNWVRALALHPGQTSSILVSGSDDLTIRFWDLAGRQSTKTINCNAMVRVLDFDPSGLLLAGLWGSKTHAYDTSSGEIVRTYSKASANVWGLVAIEAEAVIPAQIPVLLPLPTPASIPVLTAMIPDAKPAVFAPQPAEPFIPPVAPLKDVPFPQASAPPPPRDATAFDQSAELAEASSLLRALISYFSSCLPGKIAQFKAELEHLRGEVESRGVIIDILNSLKFVF